MTGDYLTERTENAESMEARHKNYIVAIQFSCRICHL